MKKVDVLVFAAHPDDAELSCGGTMALLKSQGKSVGIVDLTQGELGTRGTPELRKREAQDASRILGLDIRENLGCRDGFFQNGEEEQRKVIQAIRRYQPDIVLANAPSDRHPDHGKAAQLIKDAFFLSGLAKIETFDDGNPQPAHRPKLLYHYIQDRWLKPDFVVDISEFWEVKLKAIQAFGSQFYNPNSNEPTTYISTPLYFEYLASRSMEFGHLIGVAYGEGFIADRMIGTKDIFNLM